jgi:hypothetical protein
MARASAVGACFGLVCVVFQSKAGGFVSSREKRLFLDSIDAQAVRTRGLSTPPAAAPFPNPCQKQQQLQQSV